MLTDFIGISNSHHRMAAETAMIFGHASGRIIVLPPEQQFYFLDKVKFKNDSNSMNP